jgi:hypothetical protein
MNENYLSYLCCSGSTMNYPLWTNLNLTFKKEDVSFIKKNLPKFSMQDNGNETKWETLEFIGNLSEQDIEYFQKKLFQSLKLPNWLSATSYGISDLNINYDEFH